MAHGAVGFLADDRPPYGHAAHPRPNDPATTRGDCDGAASRVDRRVTGARVAIKVRGADVLPMTGGQRRRVHHAWTWNCTWERRLGLARRD